MLRFGDVGLVAKLFHFISICNNFYNRT